MWREASECLRFVLCCTRWPLGFFAALPPGKQRPKVWQRMTKVLMPNKWYTVKHYKTTSFFPVTFWSGHSTLQKGYRYKWHTVSVCQLLPVLIVFRAILNQWPPALQPSAHVAGRSCSRCSATYPCARGKGKIPNTAKAYMGFQMARLCKNVNFLSPTPCMMISGGLVHCNFQSFVLAALILNYLTSGFHILIRNIMDSGNEAAFIFLQSSTLNILILSCFHNHIISIAVWWVLYPTITMWMIKLKSKCCLHFVPIP